MTNEVRYEIQAEAWRIPGPGGWYFLTLPKQESVEIKAVFAMLRKPYGSIPVVATIGKTSWKTSIFPDKKSDTYSLPLKAEVREKEAIEAGDTVRFQIEI